MEHMMEYTKRINNKRKATENTGNDNLTDTTTPTKKRENGAHDGIQLHVHKET